jgi:spermidine/putrescine transport system permease protein
MTKRSSWALPYLIFLVLFVALPLLLIIWYAFQDGAGNFTFGNFTKFFTDADAIATFALSLEVAIENTLICILLGYPAAWILANKKLNRSAVTIVLFIMPMWINALMRTLATAELFHMLGIQLGKGTLLIGMVYDYLPFMIYPIYNILNKMDKSYVEAASDLGSNPFTVITRVVFPLSIPGIISGITMVFVPSISTFYISQKLGGGNFDLIGDTIERQFQTAYNYNLGASMSFVLMLLIIISMTVLNKYADDDGGVII